MVPSVNSRFRGLAVFFLLTFLFQIGAPTLSYALSGGPSQPEVQSFSPIGTSDMVDVFSGDMNYNIPLLDVDGYPVNLFYNSGVTMDSEASWVGLGWNINAGVINRAMRGVPDDFKGDQIVTVENLRENVTTGVNVSAGVNGVEIFGGDLGLGVSTSNSITYNNYNGWNASLGITASLNSGKEQGLAGNMSLGITSSASDGAMIQPSLGLTLQRPIEGKNGQSSLGISIGGGMSTRSGVQSLSASLSGSVSTVEAPTKRQAAKGLKSRNTRLSGSTGASFNLGQQTYTPSAEMNYKSWAINGTVSGGGEVYGLFGVVASYGAHRSKMSLRVKSKSSPAYGYLNLEQGSALPGAITDFNREHDGSYNTSTLILPQTSLTNDIFSVQGHGVGGSYKATRHNLGFVTDPIVNSIPDDTYSLEVEVGAGGLAKLGGTLGMTRAKSYSGRWSSGVSFYNRISFKGTQAGSLTEKVFFREAGELSIDANADYYDAIGGNRAMRVALESANTASPTLEAMNGSTRSIPQNGIQRLNRSKRNQLFDYKTVSEANSFSLLGEANYQPSEAAKPHHIGEIVTTDPTGNRFVYAHALYNTLNEEITAAVGATNVNGSVNDPDKWSKGTIGVDEATLSIANQKGKDNYYNSVTTPAYAHSYALSAILSADYIDSDGVPGPSLGDYGTYTKFSYETILDYKWRTPIEGANYSEGLKSDPTDDKGHVQYGEKELSYLQKIETKNHVAVFHTSERKDGRGVLGRLGGASSEHSMLKLDKIMLYTRAEYEKQNSIGEVIGVPVKTVHFVYSYSLCEDVPNFIDNPYQPEVGDGKLTLERVYFTYRNSELGAYSPYTFDYSDVNPEYNLKHVDRWGMYKNQSDDATGDATNPDLLNAEFPYTQQDDDDLVDELASAWHLKRIHLPSGGTIEVDYERDDYGYVQNRMAMSMFEVIDAVNTVPSAYSGPNYGNEWPLFELAQNDPENPSERNKFLIFKLRQSADDAGNLSPVTDIAKYVVPGEVIFYRALMKFTNDAPLYEYVPGYASVQAAGVIENTNYGWIKLAPVSLEGNDEWGEALWSPITRSALQFGRMQMQRLLFESSVNNENQLLNVANAILTAIGNFEELFTSPNKNAFGKGFGKYAIAKKTMIRLREPDMRKKGGDVRVKRVVIHDNWNPNGGVESNQGMVYGQEYSYTLENGESSGVASYEPPVGGEENPFKQPVNEDQKLRGAPDIRYYKELPFCESYFPSARVGYSRVVVKNLQRVDEQGDLLVTRTGTGYTVHEFYTARDFPTVTRRTDIDPEPDKTNPFAINSLLKLSVHDYMTTSQGFVVEVNDMHGKPKSETVFPEPNPLETTAPESISRVEYFYKSTEYVGFGGQTAYKLENDCTTIDKNGAVSESTLGLIYDMVLDVRESSTQTTNYEVKGNLDGMPFPPIAIPTVWPWKNKEERRFRSIVATKVIERFGVLERTVATQDGSMVETENLAYDAETGQVLLTRINNEYGDDVYTLNYPAYWHYEEMGPSYSNQGYTRGLVFDATGQAMVQNAETYYSRGDELGCLANGTKAWVVHVEANSIWAVDETGAPYTGGSNNLTQQNYKVYRSGRRNLQNEMMASITTRVNPLPALAGNAYSWVLQASAIEYNDTWPVFCDCDDTQGAVASVNANPYLNGSRGIWLPYRTYAHLTNRKQGFINGNTNLRDDGFFSSYNPFYKLVNDSWVRDYNNWTFAEEVTKKLPVGQVVENRNALEIYSANEFGYNFTLPHIVGVNTQYTELAFEGFEDYVGDGSAGSLCSPRKLNLVAGVTVPGNPNDLIQLVDHDAHTGFHSLRVEGDHSVSFPKFDPPVEGTCGYTINVVPSMSGTVVDVYIEWNSNDVSVSSINYLLNSAAHTIDATVEGSIHIQFLAEVPYMAELILTIGNGSSSVELITNQQ